VSTPRAKCGACGQPTHGKSLCGRCYANRGRKPPTAKIGACGHEVSRWQGRLCRACYDSRGRTKKTYLASVCGHASSKPDRQYCRPCYDGRRKSIQAPTIAASTTAGASEAEKAVLDAMKRGGATLDDLSKLTAQTPGQVLDAILALKASGLNVHQFGEKWSLERHMPMVERTFEYTSRKDHTFVFGVASDAHLCSKYAREDVLSDLYDRFAGAGVDRVFNAGNWIDGEADFNRFDLSVHGLEPQVNYLVDKFPQRPGLTTYAIWGEDHEGWHSRREGIDVGRFAEGHMRQAGRSDWVDLGFIEARVDLVNAETGVKASLVVMHPGGGSSYAYSYRSQKLVESLSGGEKPSVLLIGHYHKLNLNVIRNVWTAQCGTTMDQSIFMRKKSLEAHVGGMIMTLEQDPVTGAIFRCVADQMIYFDRRYYNDRWSQSNSVVKAPRYIGGVVPA
jgi:hypothetical protein